MEQRAASKAWFEARIGRIADTAAKALSRKPLLSIAGEGRLRLRTWRRSSPHQAAAAEMRRSSRRSLTETDWYPEAKEPGKEVILVSRIRTSTSDRNQIQGGCRV